MLFCSKNKVIPESTNSHIATKGQLKVVADGPVVEANHVLGPRKPMFSKYFSANKIGSAE